MGLALKEIVFAFYFVTSFAYVAGAQGIPGPPNDRIKDHPPQLEGQPVIHNWKSPTMQGFPPAQQHEVNPVSLYDSQAKFRWGVQRLRELFPTHSVSRGSAAVSKLPRKHCDIRDWKFPNIDGEQTTFGEQMELLNMDAVIVLKDGTVLWEEYFHGMKPETPHMVFSMSKSLVATVVATLLGHGEGRLDPDAAIETYVPQLRDTGYAGATIRQILDMESAIQYRYLGDNPEFALHELAISPKAVELGKPVGDYNFLPQLKKIKNKVHGEGMFYKESDPCVLVWACEQVSGKRFADLVREKIWSPLGAEFEIDVQCDLLGHWTYNISMRLPDVARWGQMCLNKGQYNGRQIVPLQFFQDIVNNASVERFANAPLIGETFPNGIGYRSFFYHHHESGDALVAAGACGQFCYMNPKDQVVIAFFSSVDPAFDTPEDLERDKREERERWNTCQQLSRLLGAFQ